MPARGSKAQHHAEAHAHGDRRGHGHGPVSQAGVLGGEGRSADLRRLRTALALTAAMMVAEAVGGVVSGSLALLSDAGHMLTDVVSLVLSMLALWFSSRPADLKRTYGFYRLEILSALVNGMTLLGIAFVVAFEAVERLRNPRPLQVGVMLAVAGVGLVVNLLGMSILSKSHSLNTRGALLHLVGDALSSVGVIVAGVVVWATGFTAIDAILSVFIAAIIVYGAIRLVREAVDVLLEAVPAHIDLAEVFEALKAVDGVTAVHDLHVWTIAHSMHALSAHLVVRSEGGRVDNDSLLSSVKGVLRERFAIEHTTLQIESEQFGSLVQAH